MRQCTRRALRVGMAAGAFIFFFAGAVLLSWIVLPVCWLGRASPAHKRDRCQRLVRQAFVLFHAYLRWTGLLIFDPAVVANHQPDEPTIIIANHPTLVDATAIMAAFRRVCVITKPSLQRNPMIGPLCYYCGYIPSRGVSPTDLADTLKRAALRLEENFSVLIFPERTRSPCEGLHRFRRGAFALAEESGIPILPIYIRAEPAALKRGQAWWDIPERPIQLTLTAGALIEPVDTHGNPRHSKSILRLARAYIEGQQALETARNTHQ
ncbi:MAG: 1-acyl-sn-glycerol-3-phosphate acyltransferase [Myxococcales bacterium]|nr:1-acyl-sn-glycerol-3-phosphate acyltransferase [Myxococcales bacterium]MCB9708888.1 1-acyl-sn-glycerol-3-phosphate acyltransferase [Myxococcales bacterium]